MKDHLDLFLLEIKLAKLSILPLISCSVLCLLLFSTLWIIFLILIGYLIFLFDLNFLSALLCVFAFNAIVLLITLRYVKVFYKNFHFEKTREHWKTYQQLQLEFEHDNKNSETSN
jgi:uncharacterized sodium:solute symporter family permease YidK